MAISCHKTEKENKYNLNCMKRQHQHQKEISNCYEFQNYFKMKVSTVRMRNVVHGSYQWNNVFVTVVATVVTSVAANLVASQSPLIRLSKMFTKL